MKIYMNRNRYTIISFILIVCLMGSMLTSCSSSGRLSRQYGNKYVYNYRMTAPAQSSNLFFTDDRILIQFRIDDAAVQFRLQNIYQENVRIDWTQASIGVRGRYSPVRHAANVYSQELNYIISNIIPPHGYTQDFAIPMENVSFDGRRWSERDLLHTVDYNSAQFVRRIRENVGSQINLILPLVFESDTLIYSFTFTVDRIERIPWDRFRPLTRPVSPPGPADPDGTPSVDNLSVVMMATGMIGVSVYLLTMKKSSPRE
jgi:hypothetical protein